jgi:hypothetical protein
MYTSCFLIYLLLHLLLINILLLILGVHDIYVLIIFLFLGFTSCGCDVADLSKGHDTSIFRVESLYYCNGFAQEVPMQRLCKYGDYATVKTLRFSACPPLTSHGNSKEVSRDLRVPQ